GVESLLEVAAAVEESDPDERDAELSRPFQVVAREDAEPARVDRQTLVDAELHREVGDEQIATCVTVCLLPPGAGVCRRSGWRRGQGVVEFGSERSQPSEQR